MQRALFLVAMLGCGGAKPQPAEHYTVRGEIATMPAGASSKEIEIHHEAIPAFKNEQGKVKTMDSMQMPFAVQPGVSLAAFQVGDKVTFDFDVVWDDKAPLHLTKLEKLPPETTLTLQ